jgi:D-glycero-D-manno-heptose 1,7-bisphosphate phosphatase
MNKAVFLDRDGTINIEKHYMYKIEDFEFIPFVIEAMQLLQNNGYRLIIITNQSGIARGYYTEYDFEKLSAWMKNELKKHQIKIDGIYYCPHHPKAEIQKYKINCKCRKPNTELFEKATRDFLIDLSQSYTVGDRIRDCTISEKTKCKGYLVGYNEEEKIIKDVKAGLIKRVNYVENLYEFAKLICI